MRNINMDTIGKVAKGVCNILVSGAVLVLSCKAINMNVEKHDVGYFDAVDVIMNSPMFSSTKKLMIGLLKRNESSEYYKTVIGIVEADGFTSDKVDMIKLLNR